MCASNERIRFVYVKKKLKKSSRFLGVLVANIFPSQNGCHEPYFASKSTPHVPLRQQTTAQEISKIQDTRCFIWHSCELSEPLVGVYQVCGILSTVGRRKVDLSCMESVKSSSKYRTR